MKRFFAEKIQKSCKLKGSFVKLHKHEPFGGGAS